MNTTISLKTKNEFVINFLIAILITLFLFTIDENAYNFNWMKNTANWLVFGIYITGILFFQCILSVFIFNKYKGDHKILYTNLIAIPLGLSALFWMLG